MEIWEESAYIFKKKSNCIKKALAMSKIYKRMKMDNKILTLINFKLIKLLSSNLIRIKVFNNPLIKALSQLLEVFQLNFFQRPQSQLQQDLIEALKMTHPMLQTPPL